MSGRLIVPSETLENQARASDPGNSVWVSANAGSGKTHILSQRVTRLLLEGTDPSKILCLTYTRAAAANMSIRIFATLSDWALMEDAALAEKIAAIEGKRPDATKIKRARQLFARALETPGGLKIQTIHAFCEALLHQFPLEANIAGHFQMLDARLEQVLMAQARREMITSSVTAASPPLANAFAHVLTLGNEAGLDGLLSEIVAKRDKLRAFIDDIREGDGSFDALYADFDLSPTEDEASLLRSFWPLRDFPNAFAAAFLDHARSLGKVRAEEFAARLVAAGNTGSEEERFSILCGAFLTQKGEARNISALLPKDMAAHYPSFAEAFASTAAKLIEIRDKIAVLRMLKGTISALTIADWMIASYEELKSRGGYLDFNDLISRTVRLLSRQDVSAWVQYKLDRGIDHILIDEAQDTSPAQWEIMRRLTEEFFSGSGSRDRPTRTVFAVGDTKQSIYSFQGADPQAFDDNRYHFSKQVEAAGGKFENVRLRHSFRSTEDVLAAVDRVFAAEEIREGVSPDPIEHAAVRAGHIGRVELWPSIGAEAAEEPDDWTQSIDHARAPAITLAQEIASTIAGWIGDGDLLAGQGRVVRAGDVLVLVRKRDRFVNALSSALKAQGVAVAGADRISLPGHIAVQDLAALGRFLLQPEDDLSLASVLKSPIFDLDDNDLMTLAIGRRSTLYRSLRDKAQYNLRFEKVAADLQRWSSEAAFRPVFEFYSALLGRDGLRAKLSARLGPETSDVLDEFLAFAIAEEQTGLPGLDAFLQTLQSAAPEIKREMDQTRNEVRIMTAHASKGLEAPVVFLVDSGSAPFSNQHLPKLLPFSSQTGLWRGEGFLWNVGKIVSNDFSGQLSERIKQAAREEYNRLLYVGMTRAEDRLIVCGYHGKREPATANWHSLVKRALADETVVSRVTNPYTGREALRFEIDDTRRPLPVEQKERQEAASMAPLPESFSQPYPSEPPLPRPLSPSGAIALIDEPEEVAPSEKSPVMKDSPDRSFAIERGVAMHRLLQFLPGLETQDREMRGYSFLEKAGAAWPGGWRENALSSVMAIISDPRYQFMFSPASRAEVSLMGTLLIKGRPRMVSGKVDRISVSEDRVSIVDYKTGQPVPSDISEVAPAYRLQMALYRAVLRQIYPGRPIDAYLLYTREPSMILLPSESDPAFD
ncbi:double-strand break repair helicase AddA [Limoniibacter endophyticus]|uniref:DNA 3'-5' helicase n=1 Tax=Limoniibacter endophyticus TaxID=1565040 RepID=A0A8J3DJU7_9HYPH|nr:double-strand break repair helicase AddA [Limoniibacter endophyticus]GHC74589.1 double-strand break repair helicase AddA [Limoniibacter endophyticus]